MIGGGPPGYNSFGSVVTFDTLNNRVFNHQVFSVSKRFTLAAGASADIIFDPIENGPFPFRTLVFLPFILQAINAGPLPLDIYFNTDSDPDGTLWESQDRYLDAAISPHLIVRYNPTINDPGTKAPNEFLILSSGSTSGKSTVGGEIKEDFIIIPQKTIRYMLRITNPDTVTATCWFGLNWFEVE